MNTKDAKDGISAMNEMGSKGFEHLSNLGELNLKIWEKLAARQIESAKAMMEQGARQMKVVGEAKGYNDLVKGQLDMAKEVGESVMAETKTNMELAGEVRDDYRSWVQTGVSEITAEMRKTVTAA